MGWKGMAIGGWVGSLFGGPLGALFGAALGHTVEKKLSGKSVRSGGRVRYASESSSNRSMIFCASVAAMLAKMAKADGRVTQSEINGVELAFRRLGFSPAAREYAVRVFRCAKDDGHTIYEYANEFASVVESMELRELFYEILWDVACADGTVDAEEIEILRAIPAALGIRASWYSFFAASRLKNGNRRESRDPLSEAYAIIGASASDSMEDLKRKYRELVKKNHPDALRAQGLPDEMVNKATERMSRINSAWDTIRASR